MLRRGGDRGPARPRCASPPHEAIREAPRIIPSNSAFSFVRTTISRAPRLGTPRSCAAVSKSLSENGFGRSENQPLVRFSLVLSGTRLSASSPWAASWHAIACPTRDYVHQSQPSRDCLIQAETGRSELDTLGTEPRGAAWSDRPSWTRVAVRRRGSAPMTRVSSRPALIMMPNRFAPRVRSRTRGIQREVFQAILYHSTPRASVTASRFAPPVRSFARTRPSGPIRRICGMPRTPYSPTTALREPSPRCP